MDVFCFVTCVEGFNSVVCVDDCCPVDSVDDIFSLNIGLLRFVVYDCVGDVDIDIVVCSSI